MGDGTVRHGIYNGTCDLACPELFDSADDAWDAYLAGRLDWEYVERAGEPVEVATDYGDGWAWSGTATRDRLTSGHDPFEQDEQPFSEWARPSGPSPSTPHDGP